jgi:hypothetical protein
MVDEPTAVPKERAQFFIPSTYVGCDGRTHEVQHNHGWFGALAVDIDSGNPALSDLVAAVDAVTGGARAEIYSSSSATADERKWRVLIPLARAIWGRDYRDTQTALFELLQAHGLHPDVALARPGQPVYLPNVAPKYRGPDGRPLFYQSAHVAGALLELTPTHPIVATRERTRAAKAAEELAAKQRAAERLAQRQTRAAATGDDFEPIAHHNEHHTVAELLARYGFQPNPKRPAHYRHPDSKNGSYATEDFGDHWVCLSEWAHTLNVGRPTKHGHRAGDAFDLYVAFEHGGDRSAAVRAYVAEVRPDRDGGNVRRQPHTPPDMPPPGRVEVFEDKPTTTLDELRDGMGEGYTRAVESGALMIADTNPPGTGKTTEAAKRALGNDMVDWFVATHEGAAEAVQRFRNLGCTDVAAIPPRDATTCQCWTAEDSARLRSENPGYKHTVPMVDALRVGQPNMACTACPLFPQNRKAKPQPVDDFAEWADPFAAEPAPVAVLTEADDSPCEYWRRMAEANAAAVLVACHSRYTRAKRRPVPVGMSRALVWDEHSETLFFQKQSFTLETMRATRDAMATAVANWRNRKARMRFGRAREIEHELLAFAEAVLAVGTAIVEHMEQLEAAAIRDVSTLPPLALDRGDIPKHATTKLARLLVLGGIPERFEAEAMDVIRRAAAGTLGRHSLYTEPVPGGGGRVQLVIHADLVAARLAMDYHATDGGTTTTWVLDADADMSAIRRAFPGVVEIAPRGVAPLAVEAEQWWHEINPSTHPETVVRLLELAIHHRGFRCCGVILPKSHRSLLFPVTRPRGDRLAEDKEPDAEVIANWGGRGGRVLAEGTAEQRLARAHALVERVRALRQFIARDEHGRLLVDHHRGAGSRGTNKFLQGTDGGVVLGLTRCPPGEVAGYMLATGRGDAVKASNGTWGDVEGELPAVGGGTTKRRWRGYACPEWAEAARHLNRCALVQTVERFRTRLVDVGKPVVCIAAEPTGLPVTDAPATIPEGVAAVVAAVRELATRTKVVPTCEGGQSANRAANGTSSTVPASTSTGTGAGDGGESGQPSTGNAGSGGISIGQPSTGHTPLPILIGKWPIETAAQSGFGMDAIREATGQPERSVRRWLADAVARGLLARTGTGRWTRYALPALVAAGDAAAELLQIATPTPAPLPLPPLSGVLSGEGSGPMYGEQQHKYTSRMKGADSAGTVHHPQPPNVAAVQTGSNHEGENDGLQSPGTGGCEPMGPGKTRTPDGGGSRVGRSRGRVPPGLPRPRAGVGRVRCVNSHLEAMANGGQGAGAAENGGHETVPDVLGRNGHRGIPPGPGGLQPAARRVCRGLVIGPAGPILTDEAPHLTAAERTELVAQLAACWREWRTPDAPDTVARDEVFAFLGGLFFQSPFEPLAA